MVSGQRAPMTVMAPSAEATAPSAEVTVPSADPSDLLLRPINQRCGMVTSAASMRAGGPLAEAAMMQQYITQAVHFQAAVHFHGNTTQEPPPAAVTAMRRLHSGAIFSHSGGAWGARSLRPAPTDPDLDL